LPECVWGGKKSDPSDSQAEGRVFEPVFRSRYDSYSRLRWKVADLSVEGHGVDRGGWLYNSAMDRELAIAPPRSSSRIAVSQCEGIEEPVRVSGVS
jgi:hypothetical protein